MTETAGAGGAARPARMDGYVRVSRRMGREGPAYISPSIQREAIERWADYRGVEIAEWHVDEDASGGTHDRPALNEAMRRVLAGETAGIVAWKIDRFSRYTVGGLDDLRRLEESGARLAFVVEDIDTSGPMGRFVYTVMLAMSEYFLESIKAGWLATKTRSMARGAILGPTPFGYRRHDDGTLQIDPLAGPIVTEAFELAAQHGLQMAVEFLNRRSSELEERAAGELKRGGQRRTWTTSTVRRLLAQRCYLGEFVYGELRHVDESLALTRSGTWFAAQPREPKRRRVAAHFPLSRLAVCATCGTHMVGGRGGRDRQTGEGLRTYRCAASLTAWKGERCSAPATMSADRLETYVRGQVADAAADIGRRVVSAPGDPSEVAAVERDLRNAEGELDAFLSDLTLRRHLRERYQEFLQLRLDAVDAARAAYAELVTQTGPPTLSMSIADLVEEATPEELGILLRSILASIVVERGRGPAADRVRLVLHEFGIPAVAAPEDG